MSTFHFAPRPLALGAALFCMAALVQAQQIALESAQEAAPKLDRVVTTGNPLRSNELSQPSSVLAGDALVLSRGASLGETLSGLPGLASTYFGPNSNRPTIRGLDGDRVRLLSNSGASTDASSLSFDHAVPVDPLVVDRIEVLRGAAALLYGGNAIGGVVNTLDNRIPRAAQPGLGGAVELRLGGATRERNAAAVLDGGSDRFAWHADLSGRRSGDQAVPAFTSEDGVTRRVRNSASDSHGGALGASLLFGSQGYAGVSVDDYRNDYGVTVEPDVTIRMQRQRLATAGEWHGADGPLRRLRWQASRTRYEHAEVEGSGAIGTLFRNRGSELRVEAEHAPIGGAEGGVQGIVGMQLERSDFSALGEEALVPASRTRNAALFVLEQWKSGPWSASAGARAERVRVSSDGDAPDAEEPRFGAASSRSFAPKSLSLGAAYKLAADWSLTGNLTRSERAPMFYELHANGVHVASGAYERGDPRLATERATGVDVGLHWASAGSSLRLNVYETRFARYIALDATGAQIPGEDAGETVPEYAFRAVPARLRGFELEGRWALPKLAQLANAEIALTGQLDAVHGINRASGEPLPRLAPLRASLGIDAQQGPWSARFELRGVARQTRVPALDRPTAGYGLVKLSVARQLRFGELDALWYLRLDNLGNKLAYSATTVPTLRELSPLPGRAVATGLQVRF